MLKILRILIFFLLLAFVVLSASLHILVRKEGRKLVSEKLLHTFNRPVKVGSVRTLFPLTLVMDDIEVEGELKVPHAVASGGMLDILNGNFVFSRLQLFKPEITLTRHFSKKQASGEITAEELDSETAPVSAEQTPAAEPPAAQAPVPAVTTHYCFIKKFVITGGTLNFIDPAREGVKVTVKDINAVVHNLQFPAVRSVITSFKFSGDIPWERMKERGRISLTGWINLMAKDIRSELKVTDIDGLMLYPYCQEWFNMEKANIGKARMNFSSEITGTNNDVVMDCHLDVAEIQFKEHPGEPEQREERLTSTLVNILQSTNKGKISLDFKIRTKMDSPEFGFGVIRSAFETKVSEAIKVEKRRYAIVTTPVRIVGGTVKTAADLTRSVINGTVSVGSSITSAFRRAFTKEKPAPQPSS